MPRHPVTSSVVLLLLLAGCNKGPDVNTAGDGERHVAKEIAVDTTVPDEVDYNGGDRTDWKTFTVENTGIVKIDVIFTVELCDVVVGVFDRYGRQITKMLKERKGVNTMKMSIPLEVREGKYYILVQARETGDKTDYTLRVNFRED